MITKPVSHGTQRVHWIAKFIREARVAQGFSQSELAAKCNNCLGSVSNYETGYYSIRGLVALERYLSALGYELHIRRKLNDKTRDRKREMDGKESKNIPEASQGQLGS